MDNAGKTTIINLLSQQIANFSSIKPTQQIERTKTSFLGKEIVIWDFGGQEKYREKYLRSPELFFSDIAAIFFVIDVLDEARFDLNVEYFKKIIKDLEEFSPDAQLILLFHKNDYEKQAQIAASEIERRFLEATKPLTDKLIAGAKDFERPNPVFVYSTTIQNPLSIIKAVSEPLLELRGVYNTFSEILEPFITEFEFYSARLFTTNFVELGQASQKGVSELTRDLAINEIIKKVKMVHDLNKEVDLKEPEIGKGYICSFDYLDDDTQIPFFLLILYHPNSKFANGNRQSALERIKSKIITTIREMDLLELYQEVLQM
jgi:GTPase SAR1 family protein